MNPDTGLTAPAPAPSEIDDSRALKRRGLLVGAAGIGAAVVAVRALPGAATRSLPVAPVASATAADTTGGYRATAHVLRYYETARS